MEPIEPMEPIELPNYFDSLPLELKQDIFSKLDYTQLKKFITGANKSYKDLACSTMKSKLFENLLSINLILNIDIDNLCPNFSDNIVIGLSYLPLVINFLITGNLDNYKKVDIYFKLIYYALHKGLYSDEIKTQFDTLYENINPNYKQMDKKVHNAVYLIKLLRLAKLLTDQSSQDYRTNIMTGIYITKSRPQDAIDYKHILTNVNSWQEFVYDADTRDKWMPGGIFKSSMRDDRFKTKIENVYINIAKFLFNKYYEGSYGIIEEIYVIIKNKNSNEERRIDI